MKITDPEDNPFTVLGTMLGRFAAGVVLLVLRTLRLFYLSAAAAALATVTVLLLWMSTR